VLASVALQAVHDLARGNVHLHAVINAATFICEGWTTLGGMLRVVPVIVERYGDRQSRELSAAARART
jgi:hypothetical protein